MRVNLQRIHSYCFESCNALSTSLRPGSIVKNLKKVQIPSLVTDTER